MQTEFNPKQNEFEISLIESLLAGDALMLSTLRSQYSAGRATSRELSGAGFFLNFEVPPEIPRVSPSNFTFGDVLFQLDGLEYGGGALLFIRDGVLSFLEGYSNDGNWPESIGVYDICYAGGTRDIDALIQSITSTLSPPIA